MSFLQSLQVYNVFSDKRRLGSQHDGGYIVNDLIIHNTQRLISLGMGHEDSFEIQWASLYPDKNIETYDGSHTCYGLCDQFPDRVGKNIFYFTKNVGFQDDQIPLNSIIQDRQNILLKVDIEGAEYHVFNDFYNVSALTGLILEVHNLFDYFNREKLIRLINHNFKDLLLFHIHGNSWGGTFDLNWDNNIVYNFPHVLELCFISKNLINTAILDTNKFPMVGLDSSNRHDIPDIDLYWINSY